MKKTRILFIDRDGTIVREPLDEQVDSFVKLEFMPGVFSNLNFIRKHTDFKFVMVSNQDGLGTGFFSRGRLLARPLFYYQGSRK